jgi:hypothetical protein
MNEGVETRARSARLSERNVTVANRLAMTGSAAQKLAVSSCWSSGLSSFLMTSGARKLAQPR